MSLSTYSSVCKNLHYNTPYPNTQTTYLDAVGLQVMAVQLPLTTLALHHITQLSDTSVLLNTFQKLIALPSGAGVVCAAPAWLPPPPAH